ncbi:flagellar hook-length control protein FliK [Pseudoduganella danionis]|uniref:Flagellar hook-length control protein FliK n=1 Tax=Pseudoduganella danionis TaxID=1890295 RepID=A0ABW9SJ20_9BURK|nr:flagellar hook-length control protein FliK [Pseudoduganella danionis]MTW31960.1 flagellar hook-length control protein FliK [Pseudoduganella danionis]
MLPSPLTIPPVGAVAAAGPAAAIGDGRQAAFQRALQSLVGQSVTGEVLSRFNDGSFMVNVAEHAVRMQLPADASVGSHLPLTVLSAEPRATFELRQASSSNVVLYGEAPAGTDDLYSPPHPSGAGLNPQASSTPAALARVALPGQGSTTAMPAESAPTAGSLPPTSAGAPSSAATISAGSMPGAAAPATAWSADTAALVSATVAARSGAGPATNASTSAAVNSAGTPASAATAAPDPRASGSASLTPPTALPPASVPGALLAAGAMLNAAPSRNTRTPLAATDTAHAASVGAADEEHGAAALSSHGGASISSGQASSQTSRAQHSAASLLGKAPLTALADLPALDAGTSQPELSPAARILGKLLNQPAAASAEPLQGKTPLFNRTEAHPAQLAQTLQNSIEDSGLFYESHLAAWSRGERTLEQLQREPQMQQLQRPDTAGQPDRSSAQQINQQLLSHEQGRVQWQGEAWPGTPMHWQIQRDSEHGSDGRGGSDAAPAPVWRSQLRLRFAALGELSVAITMVGQQVHLQLQTDQASSTNTLRTQAGTLEQAMSAAGINLASLQIEQGDQHDG